MKQSAAHWPGATMPSVAGWPGAVTLALLAALLAATGADLWRVWMGDASLGHAPLLPLVAAWIVWQRRARLREWTEAAPAGASLAALSGLLHVGAYWADVEFLKPLSAIGLAAGLCWFLGGRRSLATCAGALGLLLFTIPWPTTLIGRLQLPLQLMSTALAAVFARTCGLPVHRDGVTLSIVPDPTRPPTYVILVAQECSGLTSLLVLLALGYLIAYYTPARWWKRAALFAATVPLALLANALRLTFILIAGAAHGAATAQWVHDHEQPVLIFACALGLMCLRALLLRTECPSPDVPHHAAGAAKVPDESPLSGPSHLTDPGGAADAADAKAQTPPQAPGGLLRRLRWAFAIGLLLFAFGGSAYARRPESDVAGADFLAPLRVPYRSWPSQTLALTEGERSMLEPDAQLMRRYTGPGGDTVELAVIAGHRKKTVHTPDYCLAGGGWDTLSQRDVELSIGGRRMPATQALLLRNGDRMLATYFFTDGESSTRNLPQFQIHQIVRRLAGRRTLGAMVRILVSARGDAGEAQRRSDDFARTVLPEVFKALSRAAQ